MKKKELLLTISIISIVSFAFIFYFNFIEVTEKPPIEGAMGRRLPIPINYRLLLSPILLLVAIVPISYYLISQRLESKLENNMKVMLKLVGKNNIKTNNKSTDINKDAILKLLNFNERKVLQRLIKRKGEVLQSEITRMEGMNKLKTHRAIKNLEIKGVIKTEDHGKTKNIILSKDIRDIMLK